MAFPDLNLKFYYGGRVRNLSYEDYRLYISPNTMRWPFVAVTTIAPPHEPHTEMNKRPERQGEHPQYGRFPGPSHKKWGPVPTQVLMKHPHLLETLGRTKKSTRVMQSGTEHVDERGAKESKADGHPIEQNVGEDEHGKGQFGGEDDGDETGGIELGYGENEG